MAEIMELSDESFADAIASTPGPVVVEFWAASCAHCRVVAPLLERLGSEHPEIRGAKVDVDQEPWLALEHRVHSIRP